MYIYGHTLISQGNSWYYLYNAHGDVVKYINANGAVLKSYDYDAFGEEADPSTTDTNPFRYAGQYFDDETGTYYLRARYYNPGNGRFTQQDSWGYADPADPLSLNLYVYCINNPVMFYDPDGTIIVPALWKFAIGSGEKIKNSIGKLLNNKVVRNIITDIPNITTYKEQNLITNYANNYSGGLMNGQKSFGELRFGIHSIGINGCGIVATYNALHIMKLNPNFADIAAEYEAYHGELLWGIFGLKTSHLVDFFERRSDIHTLITDNPDNYDVISAVSDVTIVEYWNDENNIPWSGAHYVAFIRNADGSITVYNEYSNSTDTYGFDSIHDYLQGKQVILYMGLKRAGGVV